MLEGNPAGLWAIMAQSAEDYVSLAGKTLFITGGQPGHRPGHRAAGGARRRQYRHRRQDRPRPHPKLPGTIYTAAAEIEQAGGKALPVPCDIRYEDQVVAAVDAAVAKFGGIDICVNNASAISLTRHRGHRR